MVSRTSFGRATRGTAARRLLAGALVVAAALAVTSCGEAVRTGNSSAYLVLNQLAAAPGGAVDLDLRDQAVVGRRDEGHRLRDLGQVTVSLGQKDVTSPSRPTTT